MWKKRALIILLFLLHLIHGEDACPPSSCGKINNISYPFRLKGDPKGCGLTSYELSCENNIALFSFYSGAFHVQAINYHNFTIRLMDPGLQQSNCSSLPRYFFSPSNFTHSHYQPYLLPYNPPKDGSSYQTISSVSWYYNEPFVYKHIVFLNCSHPVTGKRKYVDTRGCVNWESNGYIYAMAGDLIAEDFEVGCDVKLVAPTSWWGLDTNTYSYAMMHTALVYGFELSWIPLVCDDRCADTDCYFSSSSQTLKCYKEAWWLYYVSEIIVNVIEGLRLTITGPNQNLREPYDAYQSVLITLVHYGIPYFIFRYVVGTILFIVFLIFKWRRRHSSEYEHIESFLEQNTLMPIRYTYKQIKKMATGFSENWVKEVMALYLKENCVVDLLLL